MDDQADHPTIEIPLSGGRYTVGVVCVGDTVRRPAQPWSPFVRGLLLHLENAGCECVPRHLGQDEFGRDMFSFVPGWVPAKFQHFEDAQVAAAGAMLRSFHDATRGSDLAGGEAVVCHHDPGPNNTVFRNGRPVAFIDFDFAAPGGILEDVGYMAWTWCVSSKPVRGPIEAQAAQLRVLADAYGLALQDRAGLVMAMIQCQSRNITFWNERIDRFEGPQTSSADIQEHVDWSRREMEFTAAHRELFLKALGV
jgi:Ser/Thr protein kinase RdoA (MazF antagonist)